LNRIRKLTNGNIIGFFYVLPALAYMAYFIAYPIISNILLSMQEITVMTLTSLHKPFVGLVNYQRMFRDPVLVSSMLNTLLFTICSIVFQFTLGFLLALFFNLNFRFAKPLRGLLMMPWMIPITITALIFKFMFTSNVGIVNQLLMAIHIIKTPIDWLTITGTAMSALIIANIWIGIPFNMILLSVGLTIIPKELYESAAIDGANKVQSFFRVTLPLLKPTIESVLILGFIYTFKVYDLVYVMTGGGPVNTTHMLSTYSYKLSFVMFKYSDGAATANILFVILLFASIVYLKFTYPKEEK
jgi:multiple sugar transport system permease protein